MTVCLCHTCLLCTFLPGETGLNCLWAADVGDGQHAFPQLWSKWQPNTPRFACRLQDAGSSSRLVLGQLEKWPVDVALSLLEACQSRMDASHPMWSAVDNAHKRLTVYHKVFWLQTSAS